jgi:adenine-specific DNA-methyltransferase
MEPGNSSVNRQTGGVSLWNVLHTERHGLDPVLAKGFACFLNSTILDKHFRAFSGHTQVNATDLRNMKYPSLSFLKALGRKYRIDLTQAEIDNMVRHP